MWTKDMPQEWFEADELLKADKEVGKPVRTFDEYVKDAYENRRKAIKEANEFAKSCDYKFIESKKDFPKNINIHEYAENVMLKNFSKEETIFGDHKETFHFIGNKSEFISYTNWVRLEKDAIPEDFLKKLLDNKVLCTPSNCSALIIPIGTIRKIDDIFRKDENLSSSDREFLKLVFGMLNFVSIKNSTYDIIPELGSPEDLSGEFVFDTSQLAYWLAICYERFIGVDNRFFKEEIQND